MSEPADRSLSKSCDCCDAGAAHVGHHNPPGQSELAYRIGTHSTFLRRMKASLGGGQQTDDPDTDPSALIGLGTRTETDPAIALLDAWATSADVLTFYQERIANEGFLRTATERRSVLELARAIGYELNPGVAAQTYLAFTVDNAPGAPRSAPIQAGTQIQSIPAAKGEVPQTFETTADFVAHVEWNELRPRLTKPQDIKLGASRLYLDGTNANLEAGDKMLLVAGDSARVKTIRSTTAVDNRTLVEFVVGVQLPSSPFPIESPGVVLGAAGPGASSSSGTGSPPQKSAPFSFNLGLFKSELLDKTLSEGQFQAKLKEKFWAVNDAYTASDNVPRPADVSGIQVFAMREKLGIFGHNAPLYESLPDPADDGFEDWDKNGWEIWKDNVTGDYYAWADLFLEREVPGIVKDSWVVLERPGNSRLVHQVQQVVDRSLAGFALSGKVTGLDLGLKDTLDEKPAEFKVRETTAYVKSEELPLAQMPVEENLAAGESELELNCLVLRLQKGQSLALSGELADVPGVRKSEILQLQRVLHAGGFTTLHFSSQLRNNYKRDTVTLSANVVRANHGEAVPGEVLGSGDSGQMNQTFILKKPPLTYVSASTPSGADSTLSVRVNGLLWQQAPSLFGLARDSRRYIVRRNDVGETAVIFGDGRSGARLPTGQENVVATYRSGIGAAGEVGADSLKLLKTRPFGIREVTNPMAASGAGDPETLADARGNAPLTVLTLDRIVSLKDYEDFARAFAGIGKAQAAAMWSGERQIVHITIATEQGEPVDADSALFQNLLAAINGARDPVQEVRLAGFEPLIFDIKAKVLPDPAHLFSDVQSRLESTLSDAFGFDRRGFGQPVTAAEVVNVIHGVEGVTAVDLDGLAPGSTTGAPPPATLASILPARPVRPLPGGSDFLPAQLLLVNEFGITLTEMKA